MYLSEIHELISHPELFTSLPAHLAETFLKNLLEALQFSKTVSEQQIVPLRATFGEIKTIVDLIIQYVSDNITTIYEYINPSNVSHIPEEKKIEVSSNIDLSSNT